MHHILINLNNIFEQEINRPLLTVGTSETDVSEVPCDHSQRLVSNEEVSRDGEVCVEFATTSKFLALHMLGII